MQKFYTMFLLELSLTTIYIIFAIVLIHVIGGFVWVMIKLTRKPKSSRQAENDDVEKPEA